MTTKLKRDQLAPRKAANWRKNFKEEAKETFNLIVPDLILQKETYKTLIGENENRVRIYLGLEATKKDDKYELCAFAVSSFLLGSGDVYADYETPVFKLGAPNADMSDNTEAVIESIHLYRKWRSGELDTKDIEAPYRQYIYPNAYLLTKFELHELFNVQSKPDIKIEFGIQKTMTVILSAMASSEDMRSVDESREDYDYASICPPNCDERSIYNT
ncbi:hypothetical protein OU798_05255 [Prolixibacteraceae bacterium Z1-6]|uniref:Uncharacterized protein n=1 Tax=Draconibacterium aestuarii TaxID=2998507 RepID=A0A9X3FBW3_9BACT|nr:hypothetical protein [Prolixibacteraceae bacterium Z1-6]